MEYKKIQEKITANSVVLMFSGGECYVTAALNNQNKKDVLKILTELGVGKKHYLHIDIRIPPSIRNELRAMNFRRCEIEHLGDMTITADLVSTRKATQEVVFFSKMPRLGQVKIVSDLSCDLPSTYSKIANQLEQVIPEQKASSSVARNLNIDTDEQENGLKNTQSGINSVKHFDLERSSSETTLSFTR